jgi:hypothetical protein
MRSVDDFQRDTKQLQLFIEGETPPSTLCTVCFSYFGFLATAVQLLSWCCAEYNVCNHAGPDSLC